MTYKQARIKLFEYLRSRGWTVITFSTRTMKNLVEPYCDVPGTNYRLWFTTQAVYYGTDRTIAHSTFIDIRAVSGEDFVKLVGGWTKH